MTSAPALLFGLPLTGLLGFGLLWFLADRATGDRELRRLVLASYGLRVLLAFALFAISYWGWPILRSQQRSGGFWGFGVDAWVYHLYGARIAEAWVKGIELPDPGFGFEYFAVVAAIYRFVGAHPLFPILFNSWLGALNGLLAYLIGRRLMDQRATLVAAALVGFWPSSLLWSSQLMKDALSWCLVLTSLWLMMRVLTGAKTPLQPWRGWLGRCLALAVAAIALTRLRFYMGLVLSMAAILVVLPTGTYALSRRRVEPAVRGVSLVALVVFCTLFARTLNPIALLSPRHPERGHFRLAMQLWRSGQLGPAEGEFHQAIALNKKDKEAYLGLAALEVERGELDHALHVYTDYLEREDPQRRQRIKQLIERIYANRGDETLAEGRFVEAASAYEHALMFGPSSPATYERLGLALAHQQRFGLALAMCERALGLAAAWPEAQRIQRTQETIRLMSEATPPVAASAPSSPVEGTTGLASSAGPVVAAQALSTASPLPPPAPVETASHDAELLAMALEVFHIVPGNDTRQAMPPPQRVGIMGPVAESLSQLDEQALKTMALTTPSMLGSVRHDIVFVGGNAVMDPHVLISNPWTLITYLPRALSIGFLAPFPWQWFDTQGTTGGMRPLTGVEMLFLYLLLPAMAAGMWRTIRHPQVEGVFLLVFTLGAAVPLSLVVANLGTLFRLRLLFLLPLLIVAAGGDPLGVYGRLLNWVRSRWGSAGRRERGTGAAGGSTRPSARRSRTEQEPVPLGAPTTGSGGTS